MAEDCHLSILERARSLRRQGHLLDAETCLRACPDDRSDLVNLELGHIQIVRGCYNSAIEHLKPLAPVASTSDNSVGAIALRLQLSCIQIETSGKLQEAKALAADVWKDILQDNSFPLSHEKIWIAIYYSYAIFLLYKYGCEDPTLKISMQPQLAGIQRQAEDCGWTFEAFSILQYRLFGIESSEGKKALESLCSLTEDQSIRGWCHYLISRIHHSSKAFDKAQAELSIAKDYFEACSHAFMLTDIRLDREAHYKLVSADVITTLHEIRAQYHKIEYPANEAIVLCHLATCYIKEGDYDGFYDTQNELMTLYSRNGAIMLKHHIQVQTLARASMQTGRLGAIVEGCNTLVDELDSFQVPHLASSCATSLSSAYLKLSDYKKGLEWAQKAILLATKSEDFQCLSIAVRNLTMIQEHKARLLPSASAYEKPIGLLSDWATRDGTHGYFDLQIEKYKGLASLEIKRADFISTRQAHGNALDWMAKAIAVIPKLPEEQQSEYRAMLEHRRSKIYAMSGDLDSEYRCLQSACVSFDKMGNIEDVTVMREFMGHNRLLAHYTKEPTNVDLLNQALESWNLVETALHSADKKGKLAKCHYHKAEIWRRAHELGDTHALRYALRNLEASQRIQNEIRLEFSTMPDIETLSSKQALVAQGEHIYNLGLSLYILAGDNKAAWLWLQRGKARAFMDLLGLGVIIPSGIQQEVENDKEKSKLLQLEAIYLEELRQSQPEDRFELRRVLQELRVGMAKIPGLKDIVNLRGGEAIHLDDLKHMFANTPNVVCVDWAIQGNDIFLFSVRPGEDPKLCRVNVSVQTVTRWKKNYYSKEDLQSKKANTWLRKLDGIVSPLATLADEGDLLVLSPTGLLTSFPLHALYINDTVLLERHPVIYTPSLTALRHCIRRRAPNRSSATGEGPTRICIFGDPSKDRSCAAASSTLLASTFNTTAFIHDAASTTNFSHYAPNARIIHFQGHASYNASNPLESYLKLSTGKITSRDFFSLPLRADLVTLICCDSSNHSVGVGDEPNGLLPALLYAGANAVIGTLWPLWDKAGAEFVQTFYKYLDDELSKARATTGIGENRAPVVHLAHALRGSVLQIRKERPEPYFWALFVLNGNWNYYDTSLTLQ